MAKEEAKNKTVVSITPPKKVRREGHSFYIDAEVFSKIQKAAKRNNMTVSEVVNQVLKQVL